MKKPPADKPADAATTLAGTAHPAGNRATRRAAASPARVERAPASAEHALPVAAGPARSGPAGTREREIATIASDQILKGSDAINIEHNGRIYQLRRTRQGKLILTK
jgi:hemin uptake protein HemP